MLLFMLGLSWISKAANNKDARMVAVDGTFKDRNASFMLFGPLLMFTQKNNIVT
jgi:hypothetical protein